jgi:cell division protein FtsW
MNFSLFKNIKGDKTIWAIILLLSLVSVLAIYSSTGSLAFKRGDSTTLYLLKQVSFVIVGFVIIYLAHIVPLGWYRRLAFPVLLLSILLLVITLLFGVTLNESSRWLRLPIIGFTFQPADIAKIGLILYLAKTMESENLDTFKQFALRILLPVGVVFFLIMWSGTSTALLLLLTVMVILFIGEIKIGHLLKTATIGVVAIGMVVGIGLTTDWFPRVATAVNRVVTFMDKEDGGEDNFQAMQSKIAIASGGVIGKGPGNSTQRHILPHPYSDFIYAIIVEEYGWVGGAFVMILYFVLLYRAIIIARSCTRIFPMLVVLGFVLSIVFQAMLNMGVAVGLFPVTGQTLPLVSLGGSSMLTLSVSLGIVLCVSRATEERNIPEKKGEVIGEN